MIHFESKSQLFSHLRENATMLKALGTNATKQIGEFLLPVFASPLTDDKTIMLAVQNWVNMHTNANFTACIAENWELLKDVELTPFKLGILAQLKGVQTEQDLIESVQEICKGDKPLSNVIKLPFFPIDAKLAAYEKTGNIEFMPEDVQDIFGFQEIL
mgnify:FL=1